MVKYLFVLLFCVSPFIFLQKCPLCKKMPQNILYLAGGYVVLLGISLVFPQLLFDGFSAGQGDYRYARPTLCLFLAILAFEGLGVTVYRERKVLELSLKKIYRRTSAVLLAIFVINILSLFIMFAFKIGLY